MRINLYTLCAAFSIAQTLLPAQNNGVKGLNDYAKTHTLYTHGGRAEITYGYLPWKDGSWTDLNGNQIPATAIYDNIEPIGSGLFLVSDSLIVDESGKQLFSGSDFSATVYSNLVLLNNSLSDDNMYGLITADGKEIVPYETMTKEELNEKIDKYIEDNPDDSLNVNLQMYLRYPNSQIIRLCGKYYLHSLEEYGIVDMATGKDVMANVKEEEVSQKIKELSGLFQNLQVTEDIKLLVNGEIEELRIYTLGDGLFLIGDCMIADSLGKVQFRKEDILEDGKKRPYEYRLKEPVICGSKIWYRCFNSTHEAFLDPQDNIIVCSWPIKQGPGYVTMLTDKLFCMQYRDDKVVFYTEDFSTNSTTPLFGENIGWNETSISLWLRLKKLKPII